MQCTSFKFVYSFDYFPILSEGLLISKESSFSSHKLSYMLNFVLNLECKRSAALLQLCNNWKFSSILMIADVFRLPFHAIYFCLFYLLGFWFLFVAPFCSLTVNIYIF